MRSETRFDSRLFGELMRSLLKDGIGVRFRAAGRSMYPAIADGDTVEVTAMSTATSGEVVLTETADGLRVHRIVNTGTAVSTRGDCCVDHDGDSHPLGAVCVIKDQAARPVPRRHLGTIVRRWVARWRRRF